MSKNEYVIVGDLIRMFKDFRVKYEDCKGPAIGYDDSRSMISQFAYDICKKYDLSLCVWELLLFSLKEADEIPQARINENENLIYVEQRYELDLDKLADLINKKIRTKSTRKTENLNEPEGRGGQIDEQDE